MHPGDRGLAGDIGHFDPASGIPGELQSGVDGDALGRGIDIAPIIAVAGVGGLTVTPAWSLTQSLLPSSSVPTTTMTALNKAHVLLHSSPDCEMGMIAAFVQMEKLRLRKAKGVPTVPQFPQASQSTLHSPRGARSSQEPVEELSPEAQPPGGIVDLQRQLLVWLEIELRECQLQLCDLHPVWEVSGSDSGPRKGHLTQP